MKLTDEQKISIHALCEEGDFAFQLAPIGGNISIHALCEEGDYLAAHIPHIG